MTRVTSRRYDRPHRPRLVRAVDAVGRRVRPIDLSERALIAAARRRAGLHDFGDERFREPLGRLVEAIDAEARLTPVGRLLTRERLVGILDDRLRVHDLLARDPERGRRDVRAPVVIAGLQRTGTTLLHRLLASDGRLRAVRSFEALHPAPRRPVPLLGDPRRLAARAAKRVVDYLAPDFVAVHPIDAAAPEEDVLLLDQTFLSTVSEATLRVPSFARWLEQQDQGPAYRHLRVLLSLLREAGDPARWVLKTPHHLEWLDTLLDVFPDAVLVWTHRDPIVTLPSLCSMVAHARGMTSDHVDPHEIGAQWTRKIERLLRRASATRARVGDARFVDVDYRALLADPVHEVRRIWRTAGLADDPRAVARVRDELSRNARHRHGRHAYALEDFGLRRADLARRFGDYRARHGLDVA